MRVIILAMLGLFSLPSYSACVAAPLACPPLVLPATPVILTVTNSSAIAPNVMFLLDNSSTMGNATALSGANLTNPDYLVPNAVGKADIARNTFKWVINRYPNFRYGLEYLSRKADDYGDMRLTPSFVPMPAVGSDLTAQNNKVKLALNKWKDYGGTPLYLATMRVANYFRGLYDSTNPSPITSNCQKNYLLIVTDGMWKNKSPERSAVDYVPRLKVTAAAPPLSNYTTAYNNSDEMSKINGTTYKYTIPKNQNPPYINVCPTGTKQPKVDCPVFYSNGMADVDGDGYLVVAQYSQYADMMRYFYVNKLYPPVQGNNVVANPYAPNLADPSFETNLRLLFIHLYDPDKWTKAGVTLGLDATAPLSLGADGWPDPHISVNSTTWGNSNVGGGFDGYRGMWHAAWNSNGAYVRLDEKLFGAAWETALKNGLDGIFQSIAAASYSAVPAAQNSTTLNTGASVYQASFSSSSWTGELFAYPISSAGVISSTATWSASCKLTGGACTNPVGTNTAIDYNTRVVITRDWTTGTNQGMAFRWPTTYTSNTTLRNYANMLGLLTNAPKPANSANATDIATNNTYGQKLVNYLRGDSTNELKNTGGIFRSRGTKLGDIIDSGPLYVGAPNGPYLDISEPDAYSAFKTAYVSRTPMIYVGANDGMLHGFNANTGQELMAYIPGDSEIYKNLSVLSLSPLVHKFFVNASPVSGDAYFKGAWHTILVSTLGTGGKSLFGLDITDPANFTESAANINRTYLFEFSSADSSDVGYIPGVPIIAKVKKNATDHRWAIIFGNGYNNSGSGKAALYILFLDSALSGTSPSWVADSTFLEIPVGVGNTANPNGLSTPYAFDKDADGVVDYVYAGDLQGNMWRFDLTDNTPVNWKSKATLLFTAKQTATGDQPITAPPIVAAHPQGSDKGLMVYFGTGKFLEAADNSMSGQTTQTFYGIWDTLTGTGTNTPQVATTNLLQQQIVGSQTVGTAGTFRLVTSNTIDWTLKSGWYLNLIDISTSSNKGERQISAPLLRGNKVIFTTMMPPDPTLITNCSTPVVGSSWLMELNSETGGTSASATFDVNADNVFNSNDTISIGSAVGYPAGYLSTVGIIGTPTIYTAADNTFETKVLSGGGLGTVRENPPATSTSGHRENWRQMN